VPAKLSHCVLTATGCIESGLSLHRVANLLHPRSLFATGGAEQDMRAEIEKLVEEIKQSVGLLRRHL
jgi:hypothetical protein